jgi:putative two-component system response regulator
MAVADVYDALTTPRVNKKAWPTEEAASWIIEQKGKHFDPIVVEAFESMRKQFEHIQHTLADPVPEA